MRLVIMWFLLSVIALVCWSGSDLFSKIGSKPDDKLSHWKMVMAVGLVMGLHALFEIFVGGVSITLADIVAYLPASAMYIISMIFGYVGLRYIELSMSSPVCNSSGAIAAILCFVFLQEMPNGIQWFGVACVSLGVVLLGVVETCESEEVKDLRRQEGAVKYHKSFLALLLPILYCIIDALGTFVDSVLLREENTGTFLDRLFPTVLDEAVANVAYELTFLVCGVCAAVYVLIIKRDKLLPKREAPKLIAAAFETAGQFAYIFALGDSAHVGFSAAIISSYCALSVLLSRIFLKEKLSAKHYATIALTVVGIIVLGIFDA